MKRGIEVEGRFKGLNTLFVSAEEFLTMQDLIQHEILTGRYHQLYISDHGGKLLPRNEFLVAYTDMLVTLEIVHLDFNAEILSNRVSIILSVADGAHKPCTSFFNLRDTDQVKFSIGQYVYCITKENMVKTVPSDFYRDEMIDLH